MCSSVRWLVLNGISRMRFLHVGGDGGFLNKIIKTIDCCDWIFNTAFWLGRQRLRPADGEHLIIIGMLTTVGAPNRSLYVW